MTTNQPLPPSRIAKWGKIAATAVLRGWLAFSISAFAVALVLAVLDQDNLLRSDDPYIPGCFAGAFCAFFALLGGGAGAICGSRIKELAAYFGPVVAISGALVLMDLVPSPEGQGIPTIIGVLIAVSGTAAYPFSRIPLTKRFVVYASIPGILFIIGYSCAIISMSLRHF
jgi:hypothetical protein